MSHTAPQLHVAIYAHEFLPHPGGVEVIVDRIVRGLIGRGHEVTVLTTAWGSATGVTREGKLTVHRLPAFHGIEKLGVPYPLFWGPGLAAAWSDLSRADVHHAHGSLYQGTVVAAAVSARYSRPLILTEHVGFVPYSARSVELLEEFAWRTLGAITVSRSARVTSYNRRVSEWLRARFGLPAVENVPNGVDLAAFQPADDVEKRRLRDEMGLPGDEILALYVGRDTEKKNLDAILDLPRLNYSLVVCGAERELDRPRLLDLGVVPHARMPNVFRCMDLLVLPSRGEGFPLVIQEAAASGLPSVILWDEGYASSVDRDVVLACSSIEELAAALPRLASDATARTRYALAGRTYAETHWSWDATVRRYEELYFEASATPASRSRPGMTVLTS